MFYKASQASTSTHDWFSLNTSTIPGSLLTAGNALFEDRLREVHEDIEAPSFQIEPGFDDTHGSGVVRFEKPDRSYYSEEEGDDYEADLKLWQEHDARVAEIWEAYDSQDAIPMWGYAFAVEDHEIIRETAIAVGLRIFEHDDVSGILLWPDSAGSSFYGAYWIELRARIAAFQFSDDASQEERRPMFDLLVSEARNEGEPRAEKLAAILGVKL